MAVDFRHAFLGVGCSDVNGCVISSVHPGSPAEKAGLMRDDVIVRFGGKTITNFDSLTELIRQREVGEEVQLEVARRSLEDGNQVRVVATSVTLAAWDVDAAVKNSRR